MECLIYSNGQNVACNDSYVAMTKMLSLIYSKDQNVTCNDLYVAMTKMLHAMTRI